MPKLLVSFAVSTTIELHAKQNVVLPRPAILSKESSKLQRSKPAEFQLLDDIELDQLEKRPGLDEGL
jgi:hypothetical protein